MPKVITNEEIVSVLRSRVIDLKVYDKTEDEIFSIRDQRLRAIVRISKITLDLNKRLLAVHDNTNSHKLS